MRTVTFTVAIRLERTLQMNSCALSQMWLDILEGESKMTIGLWCVYEILHNSCYYFHCQ